MPTHVQLISVARHNACAHLVSPAQVGRLCQKLEGKEDDKGSPPPPRPPEAPSPPSPLQVPEGRDGTRLMKLEE